MVYVDELKTYSTQSIKPGARHCGRQWCHLHSDSEEELHGFAAKLGLKRYWFQNHHPNPLFWHYDLVPSKRALAVRLGAKEITTKEWVQQYLERRETGDQRADPGKAGDDPRPD